MSIAEPKQKRHWPYLFNFSYEDENHIYHFTVLGDITVIHEPESGIDNQFADFEFKIASLDFITIKGELPGEPDMKLDVTDEEHDCKFREWFSKHKALAYHDELQSLCIAEYEEQHEPDCGI